jgi:putative ABC transport system permease protein
MFTFNINFISYLLSFIITLLFLFIVNLFMHFELKKLDMVEALKSYE